MDSIIPRELIKQPENEEKIIASGLVLKFIGGLIGFIISLIIFYFYKNCTIDDLLPLSLVSSLLIFQSLDVFDLYFKSKLQAKYTIYARNTAFLLVTLVKLYLIWTNADLIWFIPTNAIEMLIGGILIIGFFKSRTTNFNLSNFDWSISSSLLKDGLSLALSGFLILIYMRIDQIMVTDMISESANGIYSTGVRMIEVLYFIPMALGESFFPGVVYAKTKSAELYQKNLLSFYSIMTYTGIAFTIATLVLARPVMSLLFGLPFDGSGDVVFVYGLTIYGTFINIAVTKYLTTENFLRVILVRSVIGVIINLILNYLLIPKYGFIGAAYASLISYYAVTLSIILFKDSRSQIRMMLRAFNPQYALEKLKQKNINS